jgi:mono/diheme cytochrome c family protein
MTNRLRAGRLLAATVLVLAFSGCAHVPGMPEAGADVSRPDKELDFHVLYKQNCSGCHGDNGRGGAAIPLNNPAYLAVVGAQNLRTATANGMSGTNMPAFAQSSGGMLTDAQVDALVQGMLREWGRPSEFSGSALPTYTATAPGNPSDGEKAYAAACARCHGDDGTGVKGQNANQQGATPHSIVDASYLALVGDQSLRSYVIAGHLDDGAPDWRSYEAGHPLSSQEITDIVAWIAAHRAPAERAAKNPVLPEPQPRRDDEYR